MIDGFLLINKPKGITTYDIIRKIKKYFSKKTKIGHTGTLDPNTDGLVVIAIGKATKFLQYLTIDSYKIYNTTMKLGIQTDTGDVTGNIINESPFDFEKSNYQSLESIREVLLTFQKEYWQTPPKYSAKKVNGKRAYDLARNKEEVNLEPSLVKINNIKDIKIDFENQNISFEVSVSKGTYIRSLIEDIAKKMNTYATMTHLSRTFTDGFDLNQSISLSDFIQKYNDIDLESIEKKLNESNYFISLKDFLEQKIKYELQVENNIEKLIQNGIKIKNKYIVENFDNLLQKQKYEEKEYIKIKSNNELISVYTREYDVGLQQNVYRQIFKVGG